MNILGCVFITVCTGGLIYSFNYFYTLKKQINTDIASGNYELFVLRLNSLINNYNLVKKNYTTLFKFVSGAALKDQTVQFT